MSKKLYPSDTLAQAEDVLAGWSQISPTMSVSGMGIGSLSSDISMASDLDAQIAKLDKQIMEKRQQRDLILIGAWDKVKRVRSHVKGNYGDNSFQYKLVGGTPTSERKPRVRKAATTE